MENVVKEILDMLNSLFAFIKQKASDLNLYNHKKPSSTNAIKKNGSTNNSNNKSSEASRNRSSSSSSSKNKNSSSSNRSTNSSEKGANNSFKNKSNVEKANALNKANNSEVLNNHPRLKEYVKPNINEKRQNLEKSKKEPKLDAFKKDQLKKQVIIQIEKNVEYLGELSIALSNEGYYDYDVKVIELIQQSRGCLNIIRRLGVDKIYFDKTYQAIKEHTDNIATLLET